MSIRYDALVAIFSRHCDAEGAIRKLDDARLDMNHFSVVEKDHHAEGCTVKVNDAGSLVEFWRQNASIWGNLWGVFFGGMIIHVSPIGPVVVVGHLTGIVFAAFESNALARRLGVLGTAFDTIGLPEDSVAQYGEALKADGSLIVAHGPAVEMAQARSIVEATNPFRIDCFRDLPAMATTVDAPF